MNDHDADAVAALADPSIVIQIGPHQAQGLDALRALASQPGPDGLKARIEVDEIGGECGSYEVAARRVQRWTETNELASEEALAVHIDLDGQGLITRAQLRPRDA